MSDPNWPAWHYGPDGASRIFQAADEVPEGWADHPDKVGAIESKPEALKSKPGRQSKVTN